MRIPFPFSSATEIAYWVAPMMAVINDWISLRFVICPAKFWTSVRSRKTATAPTTFPLSSRTGTLLVMISVVPTDCLWFSGPRSYPASSSCRGYHVPDVSAHHIRGFLAEYLLCRRVEDKDMTGGVNRHYCIVSSV